jgi:hypothetical protein
MVPPVDACVRAVAAPSDPVEPEPELEGQSLSRRPRRQAAKPLRNQKPILVPKGQSIWSAKREALEAAKAPRAEKRKAQDLIPLRSRKLRAISAKASSA